MSRVSVTRTVGRKPRRKRTSTTSIFTLCIASASRRPIESAGGAQKAQSRFKKVPPWILSNTKPVTAHAHPLKSGIKSAYNAERRHVKAGLHW